MPSQSLTGQPMAEGIGRGRTVIFHSYFVPVTVCLVASFTSTRSYLKQPPDWFFRSIRLLFTRLLNSGVAISSSVMVLFAPCSGW
nr:unnamed protein product [Spirometra erinaceieuropaei]